MRNGAGLLDTLPEGKLADQGQYKRVYSDWKPTIEKTDVVRAMEAIEGNKSFIVSNRPVSKKKWGTFLFVCFGVLTLLAIFVYI
jgi:hypothetical protein